MVPRWCGSVPRRLDIRSTFYQTKTKAGNDIADGMTVKGPVITRQLAFDVPHEEAGPSGLGLC
jgi:hypothetical protein